MVVAEEFEISRLAATLVDIDYEAEEAITDIDTELDKAFSPPKKRHRLDGTLNLAAMPTRLCRKRRSAFSNEYRTPIEHHNPMETFGTTAVWEGEDAIRSTTRRKALRTAAIPRRRVRARRGQGDVICRPMSVALSAVGLRPNYQLFMAVLAAIGLKRSVRVALTRQQMFTLGYRPQTIQTLSLAAEKDGGLVASARRDRRDASRFEDFRSIPFLGLAPLYHCANAAVSAKLARVDLYTPAICARRRRRGHVRHRIRHGRVRLCRRRRSAGAPSQNYSETDQNEDKPFSSKALKGCYQQGAERFGWSKRKPEPRSMREGRELVG